MEGVVATFRKKVAWREIGCGVKYDICEGNKWYKYR